jgi:hypothetical protein
MKLRDYIKEYYKSQVTFAAAHNVAKSQVSTWISEGWIVIDHKLYSPRRPLIRI